MRVFIRLWRNVMLGLGLLSLCCAACAAPPRTLRFEQFNVEQGLAQESVMMITQDHLGFMWFGGQGGLSRYDGYRVTVYKNNPVDPHSINNDWILCTLLDSQNRFWVGTRSGLNLFDPATERFTRYSPGVSANGNHTVRNIVEDGHGGLWLASRDGLQHFDPATGRFTVKRHDATDRASLSSSDLRSMARDAQGNLWISTDAGIDRLAPGAAGFDHFRVREPTLKNATKKVSTNLAIDETNTLWFDTEQGLEAWKLSDDAPLRQPLALPAEVMQGRNDMPVRDRDGNLWFYSKDGLKLWDARANRLTAYRHQPSDPHSLADNNVQSVYQDRTGTLWVGTWTAGLSRVDLVSGGFTRIVHAPGTTGNLSSNKILHLEDDRQGNLWLGTFGGGLNLLDPISNQARSYRHDPVNPHSISDDRVYVVRRDKAGRLWVGTHTGLNRYDPATGRFTVRTFATGNPNSNLIADIVSDSSGILWLRSLEGLHRFDPETNEAVTFKHDPLDPTSVASNELTALHLDPQGIVWLGTLDGLDRFDPATRQFTHFRHDPNDAASLPSGEIGSIITDTKGTLWIAASAGLIRMEKDATGAVRFRLHVAGATVDSILEDDLGRLWLATDAGVSLFDPKTGKFQHYTSRDGMIDGAYFSKSALRTDDGTFYFGGANGLTAFRPELIRQNLQAPPVVITDFQIFNQSIRGGKALDGLVLNGPIQNAKEMTMSYLHSVFSIEFAALHYADPQRNQFAYQLQGFDKNWITVDASRRIATYTNLDPGTYVFRAKAANKNGVWNETGATLKITITPPFWKTWWFRGLLAASLLGSLWAAYRSWIHSLLRQKRLLENQVEARTGQVIQQMALVQQQKDALAKSNDALALANEIQEAHQSELTRFLAVASHDLRQPMHALNLYLGALTNLDLPAVAKPVLGNVRQCAQIMDSMFLALLDLSRLDAQVVQPQIDRFPVASMLSALTVEFAPQAAAKGIEFHVEASAFWVESDKVLVEQIFRNLVANAVRYTAAGEIVVSCARDGDVIRISVRDTGIGISPRHQKTVFEEFAQVGHAGRDRTEGLGLGLAIVRRLGRLLKAPVTLVSDLGRGSTFSVDLPMANSQAASQLPGTPSRHGAQMLSGQLIVVVDDEESILDAMRVLLESWGCTVVTAVSGSEAIASLSDGDRIPDILICDYRLLLNETGLEVIDIVRAEFNSDIKALLITGDTARDQIQAMLASGFPILHKPVQADALLDALVDLVIAQSVA